MDADALAEGIPTARQLAQVLVLLDDDRADTDFSRYPEGLHRQAAMLSRVASTALVYGTLAEMLAGLTAEQAAQLHTEGDVAATGAGRYGPQLTDVETIAVRQGIDVARLNMLLHSTHDLQGDGNPVAAVVIGLLEAVCQFTQAWRGATLDAVHATAVGELGDGLLTILDPELLEDGLRRAHAALTGWADVLAGSDPTGG